MSIVVRGLSKTYGRRKVVDDISFVRDQPSITGFLGPNGSGKSTTLRMLLGLTRPDAGVATFDGQPYARLPRPGLLVGSMLDAQANHRGRTGREVLRLAATTLRLPQARADECLELVGLSGSGSRRFGAYSLGMKQRLGIAQALLARPRHLVLDEPANGLDPDGIWWMRDLLRSFVADGGIVLLSSHLINEVQLVADSVVMIGDGRLLADAPVASLVSRATVRTAAEDMTGLRAALTAADLSFSPVDDGRRLDVAAEPAAVGRLALARGLVLTELGPSPAGSLESVFFALSGSQRAPSPTVGRAVPAHLQPESESASHVR